MNYFGVLSLGLNEQKKSRLLQYCDEKLSLIFSEVGLEGKNRFYTALVNLFIKNVTDRVESSDVLEQLMEAIPIVFDMEGESRETKHDILVIENKVVVTLAEGVTMNAAAVAFFDKLNMILPSWIENAGYVLKSPDVKENKP